MKQWGAQTKVRSKPRLKYPGPGLLHSWTPGLLVSIHAANPLATFPWKDGIKAKIGTNDAVIMTALSASTRVQYNFLTTSQLGDWATEKSRKPTVCEWIRIPPVQLTWHFVPVEEAAPVPHARSPAVRAKFATWKLYVLQTWPVHLIGILRGIEYVRLRNWKLSGINMAQGHPATH